MAQSTIEQFASELKMPAGALIEQLAHVAHGLDRRIVGRVDVGRAQGDVLRLGRGREQRGEGDAGERGESPSIEHGLVLSLKVSPAFPGRSCPLAGAAPARPGAAVFHKNSVRIGVKESINCPASMLTTPWTRFSGTKKLSPATSRLVLPSMVTSKMPLST